MKYYSKPPSELQSHSPQKSQGGISKKKLSRVILFVDLILVLLVALYFKSDIEKNKKILPKVEKKIEFSNLKIISSCKKMVGCHISIHSLQKKLIHIDQINWTVASAKQKENQSIYAASSQQKHIKPNNSYENTFAFPLDENQIIHVELRVKQQAGIIRLQAFP